MTVKFQPPTKLPTDLSLLDDKERAALSAEARKAILDEMKQDARDKFFERELARLKAEKLPADQYVRINIDSAEYVPFFMLDGHQYFNGYTYDVPRKVAAVLMEQMQRSWQHQEELNGRSKYSAYRRPRDAHVGPAQAGTATRGFATGHTVDLEG